MNKKILSFAICVLTLQSVNLFAQNEDVHPKLREFFKTCKSDIQTVCKGVKPGGGRIMNCLNDKQAEIQNTECKTSVKKIGELKAARRAKSPDGANSNSSSAESSAE